MPNCYCTLATIKDNGTLGLTATTNDTQILRIIEVASRELDKYCDRWFYIYEGTLYQDGGATRVVLDFDVQTITANTTGLTVDTDGDSVYESAYTVDFNNPTSSPDAFIYPQNVFPKTRLEANPWGNYGHFGAGIRKAIKLTGTFGYGADWPADFKHTAVSTVGAALTSTDSTVSVTASTASEFSAGQTLRIGSEQAFINAAPTGSSCPITRAVNGTGAASATTGTAVSIYDYPQAITQACLIQTVRTWKRRESGFVNTIINTDMGNIQVFKGLDPDVKEIVNQYRRMRISRYF